VAGFLGKQRIIAPLVYNRWLIPPCALATHLCIGQAYALSVFNLPLTRQLGVTQPAPGDWKLTELGWTFTIAIFSARADSQLLLLAVAWLSVGLPLAWGVEQTIVKALALFT
jgi:hypothetical protein